MDDIKKILELTAKKFGKDFGIIEGHFVCFPLPSLSTNILFGFSGFPFGHIIHLYGEEGSLKTTTAVEICRWILRINGDAVYIDTEGRVNKDLFRYILGDFYDRFHIYSCASMDEWMVLVTEILKEKPTKPLCIVVDSIFGSNLAATRDNLFERGPLGFRYAAEARELSDFLRSTRAYMAMLPCCWVLVNHMKLRSSGYGNTLVETCPGGNEIRYHSTLSLRLSKGTTAANPGGKKTQTLYLKATKNTYRSEVMVSVPVFYEADVDRVFYGWHSATTYILSSPKTEIKPEPKASLVKQVNELVPIDIRRGGRKGDLYSCHKLGLVDLTAEEFGSKIMEIDSVRKNLFQIFGIGEKYIYDPQKSWEENLDAFRRQEKERAVYSSEGDQAS